MMGQERAPAPKSQGGRSIVGTPRSFDRGRGDQRPRFRSIATICLVLVASGLVWAATASQAAPQACTVAGGFEIDGDMTAGTATCAPAGLDWNSTPPLTVQATNQGGTYKTAGKDGGDPTTWQSSGATPNKADFSQAYATSHIANNHFFAYVAWERTDTTGTQGYAIEVDNSPARVAADGTPQPDRSNGGTVFYLSANGSNPPIFDGECTFTSQATYGTQCDNNQANLTFAINQNAITDPISNTNQIAGSFFEVALDITGLNGVVPSCPGAAATTVYLRSITGQTFNGNLKGYMQPLQVKPDSTCVPPPIVTTASGNGAPQPAGSAQHDTANVGDPNGNFGAPTPAGVGSVKFFLCSPADVAANGGDCATGGAQVGAAVTLDANGQATSTPDVTGATSPNDNANGTYCWRAEFTPNNDHNYSAGPHTNSTTECFTITGGTPSVSTQIAVTGGDPPNLGFTTLGDTATLSPLFPNAAAADGETVDFNLYGPYASGVTPDCQAAQLVFSTSGTLSGGSATTAKTYTPTAAGTYVWIASYPQQDAFNKAATGACSDSNESATILAPDLSITKTADNATVNAGDQIGFTITVTNSNAVGTGTAKNVTIDDTLPGGPGVNWSFGVVNFPGGGFCSLGGAPPQNLHCAGFDLAAGASMSVEVISNTDFTSCATYQNTATANAANIPQPIQASDSTTVQCPALSFTKTADNATVNAGDQIGFTITATNGSAPGTGTATGVVIDDPLPAGGGVDWSIDPAFAPAGCSILGAAPNQTLHCTAVDLAPGASETVHVISSTDKTSCQAYPNVATLTATANHPQLQANDTTTVNCASIQIVKTADAKQVNAGDPIGFTMTVFNTGAGDAKGTTLTDTLPTNPGLNWKIDAQGVGWTAPCAIAANVLTCGPDTVPANTSQANSTFTVHITSTTDKTTGGTCLTNSGIVTNEGDVSTTNDGSDKSTDSTCVAAPSVTITKTADHSAPVNAGSSIGFTVEVKNGGPGDATGVVLNDALPAGSGSGVTWAIDPAVGSSAQFVLGGAPGAQTLSLASGTVPAGADYKVHVTAATSQTECSGAYDNTATLTVGNGGSPAPAGAHEACAYRVDLSVTKAGSPTTQDLGAGNITWTIVVTNNGPDTDTGVVIGDPMPAGNTFVSATTTQGTCTGGAILNCNIGTMAAGATVTITLVTTPSAAGTQTNTVNVAGALPETNTTNNQATATVKVTAPFVPPPVYCVAVSKITPNQLFVGRKTKLTIHLTKHGKAAKGVRVLIRGPKLHLKTKRSNARGIIKQVVKMKKAGIDTFTPLASKHCNTKRIGVTGVFTPPVTG
jgi:uncharacterized repeat protein (TIGR01451 family)